MILYLKRTKLHEALPHLRPCTVFLAVAISGPVWLNHPKLRGCQTKNRRRLDLAHQQRIISWKDKAGTDRALELLAVQLHEITRVVPAAAVVELSKVPLWFSPEYPGVPPKAEYHPGAGWLRDNKRDPSDGEGGRIPPTSESSSVRPNGCRIFALHELAACVFHDRVSSQSDSGNEALMVKAAFENAFKAKGLYDYVEQRFGDGRSANVRAYAMTNPMEYFAECSEAFFSTNDFFPFTREQLAKHDPEMFALLKTLWGEPAASPTPVKVFHSRRLTVQHGGAGIHRGGPKTEWWEGVAGKFLVKRDAATAKRFAHLVDETGQWRLRDDVWISYLDRKGPLTVGYGARKELIGPELAFGWVMGDALDEPVLLIKCAWGGKSLAVDFRPPSSAGKRAVLTRREAGRGRRSRPIDRRQILPRKTVAPPAKPFPARPISKI